MKEHTPPAMYNSGRNGAKPESVRPAKTMNIPNAATNELASTNDFSTREIINPLVSLVVRHSLTVSGAAFGEVLTSSEDRYLRRE
ncbi:hypothetical protein NicSoilC5_08940 [Arthrobacter sp. NicSoilC5]|nr:hypothetical protein NicSoilC5_08940 [Arthrobacter sp. NicSoilC5]